MTSSLPADWEMKCLDEVAEVIMGQSPSSEFYNQKGNGLPFFQGKAEFTDFYPVAKKWCTKPSKIAEKDDVLISVRAPVGPTNFAPAECCIGRGLAAIRPKNGVSSKYVLYYLRSIENGMDSLGTGTTFKAISGKILKAIDVPVAPPDQRERIVAKIEKQFSRLDEAVASLKRVKGNLKRYKAAVLKAAVEGKLTEEWREQNPDVEPASKLLDRILAERRTKWEEAELAKMKAKGKEPKDDKWKEKYKEPLRAEGSSDLPEGWVWSSVNQIAEVQLGKMLDKKKHTKGVKKPYLRNINVRWGSVDTNDCSEMFFQDHELDRYGLEEGDVLVCEGGEPGRAAIWGARLPDMKYQKALHRVRLSKGINAELLVIYLEYLGKSGRLERWFTGTTIKHFTRESFSSLPFPLAPEDEQKQVNDEIDQRIFILQGLENQISADLKRAEQVRQSILARAFSDQLI